MDAKKIITDSVEKQKEKYINMSKAIWEYAEGGYQEYQSAELLCSALEDEGFTVTRKLTGIDTAFKGVWGKGEPVIGILGEFDALPGLSQKAGVAIHDPLIPDGRGHGCGHNLLGVGSLAAAVAVKEYLNKTEREGTIIYFGTPAEEVGAGKIFLARDGAFDGVDYFYTWHPGMLNGVDNGHANANYSRVYTFHGVAAHAGGAPHIGRSALDAVELMSVGVNYLREHIIPEARVHYAYQDAGGTAPNVVQNYAQVKYLIRAPYLSQVDEITERIDDIARGAALMSGTTVEFYTEAGYSDYESNNVLAEIMDEAFHEIGAPEWEDEDYALAKKFSETIGEKARDDLQKTIIKRYGEEQLAEKLEKPLDTIVSQYDADRKIYEGGSTDVGDVGYIAPTVQCYVATGCLGTPGHSWQKTAQSGSCIGQKGMLQAAKIVALASVRVLEQPEKLEKAKKEFLLKNNGVYRCPVEKGVKPPKYV